MADWIPPRGAPDTLFDRLRAYLTPFDAQLFERAAGASDERIAYYSHLAGFDDAANPLPRSLRAFWKALGTNDGGLFADLQIIAKIDTVIQLYEDCIRSEPDSLNPQLPIVASFLYGDQLSLDRRQALDEPPIAMTGDGEYVELVAASWEALVMRAAVLRAEPRRLPEARWIASSAKSTAAALGPEAPSRVVPVIDAFAARHQLPTAWLSDERHRIAIAEERSLYAKVGDGGSVLLYAFASDRTFLTSVVENLGPAVGSTRSGTLGVVNGLLQDTPA